LEYIHISFEITMLVTEQFLKGLIKKYGKHSIQLSIYINKE
jgi:hypothetical protein